MAVRPGPGPEASRAPTFLASTWSPHLTLGGPHRHQQMMLGKWHVFVTEVKDRIPSSNRGFLELEAGPRVWKLENIVTPEREVTTPETNPQMLTHLQGKQRWGRNPHQPQREGGESHLTLGRTQLRQ